MSIFTNPDDVASLLAMSVFKTHPAFSGVLPSEDEVWAALLAAEADAQRRLRVFLEPTVMVPSQAPPPEIDALENAGTKYALEAPSEYEAETFSNTFFGCVETKQRPIVRGSITSIRFVYPGPGTAVFEVPAEWIRPELKYGLIHLIPTGLASYGPMNAFVLQALTGRKTVPMMIEVRYTAGLTDAHGLWPDVVDTVKKMAVLRLIEGAFPAQSASISADGLSQSASVDTSKYSDMIDKKISTLKDALWGVRVGVL
ncbi:hypothetical protein [Methylomagnum ishizawai]|uniref:hypothetical protein n=1 Tax=Methylomagnum ishizawai TaxID=1760988 RepID=UPI001C32E3B0|nr:hypothetical protein [Methylomagnum ishizawai]BBL75415.1 hypothetical protein MishRS11D_25130 [Methylomagnum ishizawai]